MYPPKMHYTIPINLFLNFPLRILNTFNNICSPTHTSFGSFSRVFFIVTLAIVRLLIGPYAFGYFECQFYALIYLFFLR